MLVSEYLQAVKSGVRLESEPEGLLCRVAQVTGDYTDLNALPLAPQSRVAAFVAGGDALATFTRVPSTEFLLKIGKDEKWQRDGRKRDIRLFLLVFAESAVSDVQHATWPLVRAYVERGHPSVAERLHPHWPALAQQRFEDILGPTWREFDGKEIKMDPAHPLHMSLERYGAADDTLRNARLFLWHAMGLNHEFRGDGFTYNTGVRGFREYLTANRPMHTLEYASIPIAY